LDDVNETLKTDFENDDVESIGGYVISLIGEFPEKDRVIEDKNAEFIIKETDKNRIEKIKIKLKPYEQKDDEKES
ncbi:MAG: transporter associated domain-containing protein, partial [Clostridia bacterium]|nr:transporter associated domain-containing protein [Clostridia bacterium]